MVVVIIARRSCYLSEGVTTSRRTDTIAGARRKHIYLAPHLSQSAYKAQGNLQLTSHLRIRTRVSLPLGRNDESSIPPHIPSIHAISYPPLHYSIITITSPTSYGASTEENGRSEDEIARERHAHPLGPHLRSPRGEIVSTAPGLWMERRSGREMERAAS